MRIQDKDVSINIGSLLQKQSEASVTGKKRNGTFFAGNLNQTKDSIEEKRKEAQQKALKVIGDTFSREKKMDDDLQERRDKISELEASNLEAQKELQKIEESKNELRESYGVKEDSQEQKDLKLLEKSRDSEKLGSNITLTGEEEERLKKIHEAGLTEYQQRSLDMDKSGEIYRKTLDENNSKIIGENAVIRGTKLERLKSSPMMKATDMAEDIVDAASDEIIGMLIQEAKDHVDEVQEEAQEKAEEKAEKEEEKEEKIQAAKEDRLENEKILIEAQSDTKDVQKELEEIVKKMKLLEEDLKGTTVDENI